MRLGIGISLSGRRGTGSDPAEALMTESGGHWYDSADGGAAVTTLPNRAGADSATVIGGAAYDESGRSFYDLNVASHGIQLPASATPTWTSSSGDETVMVCARIPSAPGTFRRIYSAESAFNKGVFVYTFTPETVFRVAVIEDDTTTASPASVGTTQGVVSVYGYRKTGSNIATIKDEAVGATASMSAFDSTLTFSAPKVGASADAATSNCLLDFFAVRRWPRSLSNDEVSLAASYMITGAYA